MNIVAVRKSGLWYVFVNGQYFKVSKLENLKYATIQY